MWREGFEFSGVAGGREVHGYVDMAPVQGAPANRISGVVLFPRDRGRLPLADAAVGLAGLAGAGAGADDCAAQLTERGDDADVVWTLRIEGRDEVRGHRGRHDGPAEDVAFTIVPETPCTGAGEWRTFSAPDWPITFDYPAAWVITSDRDDITVECPSVTRLARGGSWLSFEQGQFEPAGRTDPYWFSRSVAGDWRVNAGACSSCPRARRSERHGITILQGAAGEHRLYRPGVGYLGPGAGITRYLVIVGDRWVSLDMAGPNAHYGDVGADGGAVLLDGDGLGDQLVRSVKRR